MKINLIQKDRSIFYCVLSQALLRAFQVLLFIDDTKTANIDDICVVKHFVDVTKRLALSFW